MAPDAASPSAAPAPVAAAPPLRSLGPAPEQTVQAVVDQINASDARLAGLGAPRVTDPEVKRFTGQLASVHRQRVTDRPPPVDGGGPAGELTAPLRELVAGAAARLAQLPTGVPFDSAYVDLLAEAHQRAIAVLDRITPVARTGAMPGLVARTREQVLVHLDEARALQRRLR